MVNRVQVGELVGNYRIERRIGEGGFAEVYLGEHQYLRRRVAIKVLTLPLTGQAAKSFLREAQTLADLEHPHIIRCSDFGMEHGRAFLVMEYASGGTVRERHPEGTVVPLDMVVSYVQQVADALQYLHARQLIHLDIKPENMLLGSHGEVLLSDFGLARFTRSLSTTHESLVGTVGYMAPEQLRRGKPGQASDQYALATMVYEWLTGSPPFTGDDPRVVAVQHLTEAPASLCATVPGTPSGVDDVVLAALAKAPEERYPSVREFAEALEAACHLGSEVSEAERFALRPEDLRFLYREGIAAKARGDLEQAEHYLAQVHRRAPTFREVLEEQLQQVRESRRAEQINHLHTQAEAANQAGAWDQEIDAWMQLLQLDARHLYASERLQLAQEHQRYAPLYQDVRDFVDEGDGGSAKDLLHQLWAKDPYYGDPAGLGRRLRVPVPLTYQQEQAQLEQEEARQEKQELAEDRREKRISFAKAAYGPRFGRLWVIWVAWFLLLGGSGVTVGALTQFWLIALLALMFTAAGSWGLGYRRALALPPLAVMLGLASALTIALTLSFAQINYTHPLANPSTVIVSTGFFTFRDVTEYSYLFLGRQLAFGLISGVLVGLVVASLTLGVKRSRHRPSCLSISAFILIAFGTTLLGVYVWGLIATIAVTSGWGFGFGMGVSMVWCGLSIGSVLGIGVGASLPIWSTAIKSWLQEK